MKYKPSANNPNQKGVVVVKFLWWPLIISIILSIILTVLLNVLF